MLIILGAIMIRIAALILEIKKEEERTIDMLQGKIASLEEELRKMNSRVREALDRKAEAQISSVDEDFWGSVLIFQKWKEAVK
jgi:cell division protein ZapA (FtsZ GTPase activity inhibitor)